MAHDRQIVDDVDEVDGHSPFVNDIVPNIIEVLDTEEVAELPEGQTTADVHGDILGL